MTLTFINACLLSSYLHLCRGGNPKARDTSFFFGLLIFVYVILTYSVQPVEGSGFMRWTRTYTEKSSSRGFSLFSSVADVTIAFIADSGATDMVDVINSTTGELLLNTTEASELDLVAIIRPTTLSDGQPSCLPLFTYEAMAASTTYAPWNGNWCGVFLMSSDNPTVKPIILLPNGTSLTYQSTPPWSCTTTSPCVMRSTEQREGQLGGCPRKSASTTSNQYAQHIDLSAESSLVAVINGNTAYTFRPLLAAVSLSELSYKSISLEGWANPIAFPDAEFVFQPLTYVIGDSAYLNQNAPSSYSTDAQGLICALVIVGKNGTLQFFDADKDDVNQASGLLYLGNISTFANSSQSSECTPFIQASLKMAPAPSIAFPASGPSPLIEPLYQTVLSSTCSNGRGVMWTVVVHNTTAANFSMSLVLSGTFQLPPFGHTYSPRQGVPLAVDIEFLLVQPTIRISNGTVTALNDVTYLSSRFQYIVCISGSLVFFDEPSLSGNLSEVPLVSLMVLKSDEGNNGMTPFANVAENGGPERDGDTQFTSPLTMVNLTNTIVSTLTPQNINITAIRSANISNVLGWVHASNLPAMANATVPLNINNTDENTTSATTAQSIIALEHRVLTSASQWLAYHGTTYSVLAGDCIIFINISSGGTVPISTFSVSDDGNELYGGVADASTSRIGPFFSATVVPQLLEWQAYPSPVAVALNRSAKSITHTKVLITTSPPDLAASYPLCVYTLVGTNGALLVNINITFINANSTMNSTLSVAAQDPLTIGLAWISFPENRPLLDTFSQSVCTVELPGIPSLSNVAPAGGTLFLTQVFQLPGQNTSIRISANPVRSVVATTSQTSFGLDDNATVAAQLSITTLDPIGTPNIFVCAGHVLYAYYLTAGNLSWFTDFSSLEGCELCTCPDSNDALLLSQDRKFVLLTIINGSKPHSPNALLIFDVLTRNFNLIKSHDLQVQASGECTNGESMDPFVPTFSPLLEITTDLDSTFDLGLSFVGVLTYIGTRCFSIISISAVSTASDTEQMSTKLSLYFFLGSMAAFSSNILFHGDNLFLCNNPTSASGLGATYAIWSFSFEDLLEATSSGILLLGVLPTFATSNVLSTVVVTSLLMVATMDQYGIISVQAFDPSQSSNYLWSTSITDAIFIPNMLPLVNIFVVLNRFACVAAGVLVCVEASHTEGQLFKLVEGAPHIGLPAVDQLGNIVFATEGYQTHAVRLGPSGNLSLSVLWEQPTWPGKGKGVDMDINTTTCSNPMISDEGLVLECTPSFVPDLQYTQRHVFILSALTGVVLLGGGPRVVPSSSSLSDNGLYITYANNFGSAITINLMGSSKQMEVPFEGSLCVTGLQNNYVVSFNHTTITAVKVPWNVSEPITIRTYTHGLKASRWQAYGGLMLGNTFTLSNSTGILLALWDALSLDVRAAGVFNIYMGATVRIMDADFGYTVMDTSQCAICIASCPTYCAVNLVTGVQRSIGVGTGVLTIQTKDVGQTKFNTTKITETITYSGNYSLNLLRLQHDMASQEQVIACNASSKTIAAPLGRYCLLAPKLNLKRWVVVEVGSSIATTAMYQSSWDDPEFSQVQSSIGGVIFSVNNVLAINNLLLLGSVTKSFPQYLLNDQPFDTIFSATVTQSNGSQSLIINTDAGEFDLASATCAEMEEDIPICTPQSLWYDQSMTDNTLKSVSWISTGTNWGDGFIRTGYASRLSAVMRSIAKGDPKQCGRADDDCEVSCQPNTTCESQIHSYWSNWLSTMSLMPRGSSTPFPGTVLQACSIYGPVANDTNNASFSPYPNTDQFVMDPLVTFHCTQDNKVALTTRLDQWFGDRSTEVTIALMPVGAPNSVTGGVTYTCTECTYFLLPGVVPEPFGWLGVGAVKNLIVCILFYWLMEKVKERQRELNESLRRIKRQKKQLIALRFRLAAHDPSFQQESTIANFTFHRESVLAFKNAHNANNTLTRLSEPFSPSSISNRFIPDDEVKQSEESLSSFQERPNGEEEMDGQPLRYLPFAYSVPLASLSPEERRQEKQEIKGSILELERSLDIDEKSHRHLTHERRWCGWFPNPLDIYAALLVRCGRFRRLEDRRMHATRIKDNFVYKEFTPESLVEMLMAILGESPANRAQVVSFAHFYQWNLCDNRQWVIREHVDEQSQFTSSEVIKSMERELQRVHNKLQDVYVMYKVAFRGKILRAPELNGRPANDLDDIYTNGLASSKAWQPPAIPPQITDQTLEKDSPVRVADNFESVQTTTISLQNNEKGIKASTGGVQRTSSYTPISTQKQRKTRLENLEQNFQQAIQQAQDGSASLAGAHMVDNDAMGVVNHSGINFNDEIKFKGMDAFAPRRLLSTPFYTSSENPSHRTMAASRPLLGDDKIKRVSSAAALHDDSDSDENLPSKERASVASVKSLGGHWYPRTSKTPNSLKRFLGDIELDEEVAILYATNQLGKQVEEFNLLHDKKPHCFEYVSLPSRKIDDKLLPSPLLIIFSLFETIITLILYASDVLLRSTGGQDGSIQAFDMYQCVFFLVFNSSLPSSLIVNVIARADLGKTTHTKNALEKVKDIITNPYVIITFVIFSVPMATHVIPGFAAYAWLMGPPLVLLCALEYYLRTRITVHSHAFVIARLISRVAILFAAAVVMSLSFNYSTSLLWGSGGYLSTGSYVQGTYWDAVANDYDSRSFSCTWKHVVYAISNFVQMGFVLL